MSQKTRKERLKDLWDCIEYLDERGLLIRVASEVDLALELAGVAKKFEGNKVVFFEKVKGYPYPVVIGLLWSREILAKIFGTTKERLPFEIANAVAAWQKRPLEPLTVSSTAATGMTYETDVDLNNLPVPLHALKDGGRYLDSSIVIANDPDTGVPNGSIHRFMITGKTRMTLLIDRGRHLEDYYNRAEKRGKSLEITLNNGAGLASWLASIIPKTAAPEGKLGIASHILGEPLRFVKARTVNAVGLADAQFIIEGEILPNVREEEGPFAEVAGYYGEKGKRWVMEVKAICHRKEPVFHTLLPGIEVFNSVGVTGEAKIFLTVSQQVPGIKAVYLSHGGCGFYHAIIQMAKTLEGSQKNAIMAAFAAFSPLKMVIIVDEDVDIYSAEDVEWALATRCDPERGILFIKDALGHELNPITSSRGLMTKIGIDATTPVPRPARYERVRFKEIDLRKYEIRLKDPGTIPSDETS